jgi:hypothetical protein
MHHSVPPNATARDPPTLWPQDDARMARALQASREENRRLKTFIIRLAEIVLRMSEDSEEQQP